MKVGVYHNNNDIRIKDVETPKISEGEILVKVMASGICGTDVMEWYRRTKAPLVLGHEVAGDVVETGEGVEKFKIGDRVIRPGKVVISSGPPKADEQKEKEKG